MTTKPISVSDLFGDVHVFGKAIEARTPLRVSSAGEIFSYPKSDMGAPKPAGALYEKIAPNLRDTLLQNVGNYLVTHHGCKGRAKKLAISALWHAWEKCKPKHYTGDTDYDNPDISAETLAKAIAELTPEQIMENQPKQDHPVRDTVLSAAAVLASTGLLTAVIVKSKPPAGHVEKYAMPNRALYEYSLPKELLDADGKLRRDINFFDPAEVVPAFGLTWPQGGDVQLGDSPIIRGIRTPSGLEHIDSYPLTVADITSGRLGDDAAAVREWEKQQAAAKSASR